MHRSVWIVLFFWASLTLAQADWVETLDGSRINGSLVKIDDSHVELDTAFVGVMRIPRTQVMKMEVQGEVIVRTEQGQVIEGVVRSDSLGRFRIDNGQTRRRVHWRSVTSAWRPDGQDPLMTESGEAEKLRQWTMRLSFDLRGRTGNAERFLTNVRVDARREGPHDRWDLYGSYNYGFSSSERSDDEVVLGTRYSSFPQGRLGWFVREELERDRFENIALRSTTAAGGSFRFIHEPDLRLEGSGGVSNRYQNFRDGSDENAPGLDIGLNLDWDIANKLRLRSRVNYLPALDDISEFFFEQDTGVEVPIDSRDFWRVQFGLTTRYTGQPSRSGATRMDNEYYTRLVLSWE